MRKHVNAVEPELERYAGLVQQLKGKNREWKNLLAQEKTPFFHISKLHNLTYCMTERTKKLKKQKTEKEMLLCYLNCANDSGEKELITTERTLQKQSEQKATYSDELNEAMEGYVEPKEQTVSLNVSELMDARLAVHEEKECSAATRVKAPYGEQ